MQREVLVCQPLRAASLLPEAWVPRLLSPSPKLPLVHISSISAGGWHSLATARPSCPIERLARRCTRPVLVGGVGGLGWLEAGGIASWG